ncbi:Hypothetical predicted protein [Olea europaea subsp. europaea]|uniref:CNNM transmembrane domain-containing protein n=1 Tax=Olea europaea subsp. europaea TaxID=158383 RepID=A0A8S0QIX5_OLEEU|nr:Hypothetical predicted protein [Olea europaea subsp. europaea]
MGKNGSTCMQGIIPDCFDCTVRLYPSPLALDMDLLAIGATVAPIVRILVWIGFPVAYPKSKLLDLLLGGGHRALFRQAELKTLFHLHGNKAGKGGELTHDETTIIAGPLEQAPLQYGASTSAPCLRAWPSGRLAKNLLTIHPGDEVPMKSVTIRRIPRSVPGQDTPDIAFELVLSICLTLRVPETVPLYDILSEFQKGHSHMAVVVKYSNKATQQPASTEPEDNTVKDVKVDIDGEKPVQKWKSFPK